MQPSFLLRIQLNFSGMSHLSGQGHSLIPKSAFPMYATFRGCDMFTSHQPFGEHLHTQEVDTIHQIGHITLFPIMWGRMPSLRFPTRLQCSQKSRPWLHVSSPIPTWRRHTALPHRGKGRCMRLALVTLYHQTY